MGNSLPALTVSSLSKIAERRTSTINRAIKRVSGNKNDLSDRVIRAFRDELAIECFEEKKYSEAYQVLGLNHPITGKRLDYLQALAWCMDHANKGQKEIQFIVGLLYGFGCGVQQDHKEALKWFWQSAEQGYSEAQSQLGFLYATGYGVEKDQESSVLWYEKASKQKNIGAQYSLGLLNIQRGDAMSPYIPSVDVTNAINDILWQNLSPSSRILIQDKPQNWKSFLMLQVMCDFIPRVDEEYEIKSNQIQKVALDDFSFDEYLEWLSKSYLNSIPDIIIEIKSSFDTFDKNLSNEAFTPQDICFLALQGVRGYRELWNNDLDLCVKTPSEFSKITSILNTYRSRLDLHNFLIDTTQIHNKLVEDGVTEAPAIPPRQLSFIDDMPGLVSALEKMKEDCKIMQRKKVKQLDSYRQFLPEIKIKF